MTIGTWIISYTESMSKEPNKTYKNRHTFDVVRKVEVVVFYAVFIDVRLHTRVLQNGGQVVGGVRVFFIFRKRKKLEL